MLFDCGLALVCVDLLVLDVALAVVGDIALVRLSRLIELLVPEVDRVTLLFSGAVLSVFAEESIRRRRLARRRIHNLTLREIEGIWV